MRYTSRKFSYLCFD